MSEEWRSRAQCRDTDPNWFFPPDGLRGIDLARFIHAAKAVCDGCPVRGECLMYARDNHIHYGVWGGQDMAHDCIPADRRPIGHNQAYTAICAGGCGKPVATPALMQPGYHKVAGYGMCQSCYNNARRPAEPAWVHTRHAHETVLRKRRAGLTVEQIAHDTGYSTRNIWHILKKQGITAQ